ncbi:small ribosomal subunit protein bS16m [Planococcus citri]|uniref:small ribosomal subunit protein bS16m n=1 Tax=Planococcus citri TaxID=170843 RepID=UPI0031F78804
MRFPKKIFTTIYGNEIWTNIKLRRLPIQPAAGGGTHFPAAHKSIRLARYGCANRPFYHINVAMVRRHQHERPIEQLGVYDPMPNQYNEQLVSINIERLKYWMAHNTSLSPPVNELLGLAGILPIHPRAFTTAWRNRKKQLKELEESKAQKENEQEQQESTA